MSEPEYYVLREDHGIEVVDHSKWGDWMMRSFEDTRRVGFDSVGEAEVSTVFLGIDHNWGHRGGPVLFETMIFCDDDRSSLQRRYRTWAEAKAGHDRIVTILRRRTKGRNP